MSTLIPPGTYIEEIPTVPPPIHGVETSVTAFLGRTPQGPLAHPADGPQQIHSLTQFESTFGAIDPGCPLTIAVCDFFNNGGTHAIVARLHADPGDTPAPAEAGPSLQDAHYLGDRDQRTGMHALRNIAFNLLCIPPDTIDGDTAPAVYQAALELCVEQRAMLLVDPPAQWNDPTALAQNAAQALAALGLAGNAARNAALYLPRLRQADPSQSGGELTCVPCGAVAGVFARTDAQRGVWKAPSGMQATLTGTIGLSMLLDDADNAALNPLGINCLRTFPARGSVVWGARTLRGADTYGDEYKYVPVRRTALFIEESLRRGIAWAVFEPNGEPLWARLRLQVGAFMHNLFRTGAFQGTSPRDAYFVSCDASTTSQADIDQGVCRVIVGFAPLKPAEFVVLKLSQRIRTASTLD